MIEHPICQVCQAKRATVSYSCWRSGRFLDRTFVCIDCAPTFERLMYGGWGGLGKLVAGVAIERAKDAGIDPSLGCPGCGKTLAEVLTDSAVGCEVCYNRFSPDLTSGVEAIHGWGAHVGKSPAYKPGC